MANNYTLLKNPIHDGIDTTEPLLERKNTYANTTAEQAAKKTLSSPDPQPGLERRITFARTLTFNPEAFDPAVYEGYVSGPISSIKRTLTSITNVVDPDAVYTTALLNEYIENDKQGNEGDLPLQTGFARHSKFWRVVLLVLLLASFMSLVAAGFINLTDQVNIILLL